jgi:hypothetical protein
MCYGWHIVTMVLLAMELGFLRAATSAHATDLAVVMTALAAVFAVW